MDDLAVQVKNASFSYGKKQVFHDISFNVKKGEVFCIIGPNGCGKTTLLDCILGLLKINTGEILVGKVNIKKTKPQELAERVAYVPQTHERRFPYKVEDIVLMGRASKTKIFSSPNSEDKEIAKKAMEKVGILELADSPYTQISGGQCQLVMIARALAQESEIIIMDEPTAHLDFKNELILLETVVNLVRENNITVIMATHFPNHAYYFETNNIPTTLALMNNGVLEKIGNPGEVLNENNIRQIYSINSKLIDYNLGKRFIKQIVPLSIVKDA